MYPEYDIESLRAVVQENWKNNGSDKFNDLRAQLEGKLTNNQEYLLWFLVHDDINNSKVDVKAKLELFVNGVLSL